MRSWGATIIPIDPRHCASYVVTVVSQMAAGLSDIFRSELAGRFGFALRLPANPQQVGELPHGIGRRRCAAVSDRARRPDQVSHTNKCGLVVGLCSTQQSSPNTGCVVLEAIGEAVVDDQRTNMF